MKKEKMKTVASAGTTVVGTAIGVGGQTAAMGLATAVGTASTGTAISTLSGAAATNAAMAWLGGGALCTGGGGMAAGATVLATIPVVGWTLGAAGLAYVSYKLIKGKKERRK